MKKTLNPFDAKDHSQAMIPTKIAVYLTLDKNNKGALDTAAELAQKYQTDFIAFYMVRPGKDTSTPTQKQNLEEIINYASKVGAHIEMLTGVQSAYFISEYCKSREIDLLVLTKPSFFQGYYFSLASFMKRIPSSFPNTQILIVPSQVRLQLPRFSQEKSTKKEVQWELLKMLGILAITMLICFILDALFNVDEILLGQIVVMGVLLCSITLKKWGWSLTIAILSIVLFNFFFAHPKFSLSFEKNPAFTGILLMTFACSLLGSFIGNWLHNESVRSAQSNKATQILLNATHLLKRAETPEQIISVVAHKISTISGKNVVYYPFREDSLEKTPILFPYSLEDPIDEEELKREYPAARAAVRLGFQGDLGMGSLSSAYHSAYTYSPFISRSHLYGVIGIRLGSGSIDPLDSMMLTSIITEGVLSYEAKLKDQELQRVELKAESDALRSNLLKALAHDIRTPLTSIIGNITTLQKQRNKIGAQEKENIFNTLQKDTLNLHNMIENLLTAARLDGDKTIDLKKSLNIMSDVVDAGLESAEMANETHPLEVIESDDILACDMDGTLIAQVVSNIVLNAIYHTPEDTPIEIKMFEEDGYAVVEVADTGPGIAPEVKKRVFDIFYTGEAPSFDSNSTLGLGLFLCREIITAHNGSIGVRDNTPSGSIFSFRLPLAELSNILPSDDML